MSKITEVVTGRARVIVALDNGQALLVTPGMFVPMEAIANALKTYVKDIEITTVEHLRKGPANT